MGRAQNAAWAEMVMERWLLDRRAVVAGLGAVGAGVIAVRSAGGQESYGEASTGAGAAPTCWVGLCFCC